jgi:hypothetical protein
MICFYAANEKEKLTNMAKRKKLFNNPVLRKRRGEAFTVIKNLFCFTALSTGK